MRFEKVLAYSFGPFTNETLGLGPGMNVIHGPNEAGKSSWHAALYAGLCGIRRGRGGTKERRAFAERHQPWDSEEWEVGVVIELADGRRIELRHDLAGLVACRAEDLALGGDCSNEIINEGTPDGSRWLGLDRRSFAASASVRQAELLEVIADPSCLQEHLQRAAATGGTDETAAAALLAIHDYFDKHVGTERINSSKPLRRAMDRLKDANTQLEDARLEQGWYLELVEEAERLEHEALSAQRELQLLEAAAARAEADRSRARLEAARVLSALLPERVPAPVEEDLLGKEVAAAIEAWESVADEPELIGPTVESLRAELDGLPEIPVGDTEPDGHVLAARDSLRLVRGELDRLEANEIEEVEDIFAAPVTEADLLQFAAAVEAKPSSPRHPFNGQIRWALTGALGIAFAVLLSTGAAFPAVFVAAALITAVIVTRAPSKDSNGDRGVAIARLKVLGIQADPASVRAALSELRRVESDREERGRWLNRRQELQEELAIVGAQLDRVLRERGMDVGSDPLEAAAHYERECRERHRLALKAARRADLERQVETQSAAEREVGRQRDRRHGALERLRSTAARCGLDSMVAPGDLLAGLHGWQAERQRTFEERALEFERFSELQRLLDGGTLEELESKARALEEIAYRTGAGLDPDAIAAVELDPDVLAQRDALKETADKSARAAHECRGRVAEKSKSLPSIAEAEEACRRAGAELDRVRGLEQTLTQTKGFLEAAQKRVHLSIAPRLQESVAKWLPRITGGRYIEAAVNPETLRVRVKDAAGRWRDAMALSHGTAEQIYLLLRVALAEHLTASGETCPLILDDVTVQSDPDRTILILDFLRAIASDRQVILFTQEDLVLDWAQSALAESAHKVVRLEMLPAA